jgi:hypothetical protein
MLERRLHDQNVSQDRRASGRDRRLAPRYPAKGTWAVLTWHDGEDYRTMAAVLRDISLIGGSALADQPLEPGTPLWFRVSGDDQSPWVGGRVVGVARTGLLGRGPRLIRWSFAEACPYGVFKSAISGFQHEHAALELSRKNMRASWS